MDPTPEQTRAFGDLARSLRLAKGWSQTETARQTEARLPGVRVGRQDIEHWETKHGPRTREKAEALDAALGAGGQLVAILAAGLLEDHLSHLEAQVAELHQLVLRLPGTSEDDGEADE